MRHFNSLQRLRKTSLMFALSVFLWLTTTSSLLALSMQENRITKLTVIQHFDFSPAKISNHSLRVMTLNMAHGRGTGINQTLQSKKRIQQNLKKIGQLIQEQKPHLLALQEVDGPSFWTGYENQVNYLAQTSHLPYSIHGQHVKTKKIIYGTALLSQLELKNPISITFKPSPPTFSKGFVLATIKLEGKAIDIVSVHLDFSRKSTRQKQVAEMIQTLSKRKNPLVLMGDLNSEWEGKDLTLQSLVKKLDLIAYQPHSSQFNTFSKLNKRFDWILISPELEFVSYQTLQTPVSDHFAVLSDLKFKNRQADLK